MSKFISIKFIIIATLTYIPYTILWFFWHNNLFHSLYYSVNSFYSIAAQNIWYMNFANALLVYGFVYFYRRGVNETITPFKSILWGIYYCLSAIGFFAFMLLGMFKDWSFMILIHEIFWAVIGGVLLGFLILFLNRKFG